MRLSAADALARLAAADHAILATLHPERGADLVPVCFAVAGDLVAVPIDDVKPKSGRELARVANLRADPRATILAERWDADDWARLWWARATLRATGDTTPDDREDLERRLRERYPQYRDARFEALLVFRIEAVTGWAAGAE